MLEQDFPSLQELGERIMILGPSNSGKSTLTHQIGTKTNLPIVHLDQLFHEPNQRWIPRSKSEFITLHDEAIAEDRWVMDGNYTTTHFKQRLLRATGLVLLSIDRPTALARYFRRSFSTQRHGTVHHLGIDWPRWEMIRFILSKPNKDQLTINLAREAGVNQIVTCHSPAEAARLKEFWKLDIS